MTIPAVKSITTADDARSVAILWQEWQADAALSYGELGLWQDFFYSIARKFGLVEEFKENGIL